MPHITIEYTESLNLDFAKLVDALHSNLATFDTIDIRAIKSRCIPVQYTLVGDNHDHNAFVHIVLKLLEGRDEVLRRQMSQSFFEIARKHTRDERVAVSVEVHEMNGNTYTK